MIGSLLLLSIVVFGLRILFGQGKIENYLNFLMWLIFAPVLLAIGYNHVLWFWFGLSIWIKVLCFLVAPFLVSAVLHVMLPKAKWLQTLEATVFRFSLSLAAFPFRFLWRIGRLVLEAERPAVKLDPHRPAVGNAPPLIFERAANRNPNH